MTPSLLGLLTLFSFFLATGQIMFKMVARTAEPLSSLSGIMGLALNTWFWLAIILYATATLLWIFILQKIDLVQAYPFMALGFIIVPVAAFFFFGEKINLYYFAGVGLIMAGLWLITAKAGL